jgi:hypothetical protein
MMSCFMLESILVLYYFLLLISCCKPNFLNLHTTRKIFPISGNGVTFWSELECMNQAGGDLRATGWLEENFRLQHSRDIKSDCCAEWFISRASRVIQREIRLSTRRLLIELQWRFQSTLIAGA